MANFKAGVIRDGNSTGSGSAIGNIKDGIIRDGHSLGSGKALGNVKDGVIRDGSSRGSGHALMNIKNGIIREGIGQGRQVGKVSNCTIKGMENEPAEEIVAVYHFLIRRIV